MAEPSGLTQTVLDQIENILNQTLDRKKKYSVFVFGSRAQGNFRQYSDLDLWIESVPQLEPQEISNLRENLEISNIPIKVDIVTPEICLPEYLDRIQTQKKLWLPKK